MNYFIQYPIYLDCNLSCPYCFHKGVSDANDCDTSEERDAKRHGGAYGFSIEDYIKWRDTHLKDIDRIVIHFHGGEPTMPRNILEIEKFLSLSKLEKVDVLTNGVGPESSYGKLIEYKDRIDRIGLTYHRTVIGNDPVLKRRFTSTVLKLHSYGLPIYVKEMLFKEFKAETLAHQRFWATMGIPFKIQDFKGYVRGEDFSELDRYTVDDINILDPEYIKTGKTCSCRKGYKQVLIRGGWHAGDILACWVDQVVVGSIQENTYNPGYTVSLDTTAGKQRVIGVPPIYRGTYDSGDRYYEHLKKQGHTDYTSTNTD